jgi:hypothetical protein
VFAVVRAWRNRTRDACAPLLLALAAIATVVIVLVALLTQSVGFTGTTRYVIVPIAVVCVLGGIGLVQAVAAARERLSPARLRALAAAAVVVAGPFLVVDVARLADDVEDVRREARELGALPDVIERAGGAPAVRRCGLAYTRGFLTQAVAWELRSHESGVSLRARPPGTIIVLRDDEMLGDGRFPQRVSNEEWTLASTCALGR